MEGRPGRHRRERARTGRWFGIGRRHPVGRHRPGGTSPLRIPPAPVRDPLLLALLTEIADLRAELTALRGDLRDRPRSPGPTLVLPLVRLPAPDAGPELVGPAGIDLRPGSGSRGAAPADVPARVPA